MSWRLPVAASITTAAWLRSKARARFVIGTRRLRRNAAGLSRPGTFVTIRLPGLNPSNRLMSVGSIGTPSLFFSIEARGIARRRPVGVERSATVK